MESPHISHHFQLRVCTQVNAFPFPKGYSEILIKVPYKPGWSLNEDIATKTKYIKEDEYWLNQAANFQPLRNPTRSANQRITTERQQQKHAKPLPVCVTGDQNISPFIQTLEQIAKEQHQIGALADNQLNLSINLLLATAQLWKPLVKHIRNSIPAVLKDVHCSFGYLERATETSIPTTRNKIIHSSLTNQAYPTHTPGITYALITKQNY